MQESSNLDSWPQDISGKHMQKEQAATAQRQNASGGRAKFS